MPYNGGVSYKGDKALAQAALPEALKLANIVRGLKTTSGVDSLVKTYTIPGGTVRVEDNKYFQHLYIDVTAPSVEEEEEEKDFEILIGGVYAAFATTDGLLPLATDTPAPIKAALSSHANAVAMRSNALYIAEEAVLVNEYKYNETFQLAPPAQLDWVSADGKIRFYTNLKGVIEDEPATPIYASKYNFRIRYPSVETPGFTFLSASSGVRYRGNIVQNSIPIGMGIYNDEWLVYCLSYTASGSGKPLFRVHARKLNDNLVATGTTYNISNFYGQDVDDYNPPNYTVDMYESDRFGTQWFCFSPDGSKAVRARVFEDETHSDVDTDFGGGLGSVGGGYTNITRDERIIVAFKEELVISMDETLIPPRPKVDSRTITLASNTTVYYQRDYIDTRIPSSINIGHDTAGVESGGVSGDSDILVACDYTTSGVLATAKLRIAMTLSGDSESFYQGVSGPGMTYDPPSDFQVGQLPYDSFSGTSSTAVDTVTDTGSGSMTVVSSGTLIYEADSTYQIPLYSMSYSDSNDIRQDHEQTQFQTLDQLSQYYEPVNGYPETPIFSETTTVTTTTDTDIDVRTKSQTNTMRGMTEYDALNVGALACMDLRNGVFVTSGVDMVQSGSLSESVIGSYTVIETQYDTYLGGSPNGSSSESTSYEYSDTGDHGGFVKPADETLNWERKDILYILNPDVQVNGLELPQVEGINTPGVPEYAVSKTITVSSFTTPVAVTNPDFLGAGSFYAPRICGAGGSVAVDHDNGSVMFSVFGSDYTQFTAGGASNSKANICKQATYLYTFEDDSLHTLTPLLWDSVELIRNPPDLAETETKKQYAQVGVIEFAAGYDEEVQL